jgi:hypothetical protein
MLTLPWAGDELKLVDEMGFRHNHIPPQPRGVGKRLLGV